MKLVRLAALVVVALQLGCEREIAKHVLGPQTSPEAIIHAQNKSLAKLDPYKVKEGETIHKVETQEIITTQGPIKNLSKEWVTTVTEVENGELLREITTLKKLTDHLEDDAFIYEYKNVYSLPQIDTMKLLNQLDAGAYAPLEIAKSLQPAETTAKEVTGVAFHNLTTKSVDLVPPQLVKSAENCKGLKDCRIQADQISYDVVFLMDDQSTQTHTVEWYVSTDVPFFAGIMKQCATSLVPVESLHVLVKQCTEVVDFDEE